MAAPVLTLEGVTKRYKNTIAVDNVNANMYSGEVIGLVGVNGSGKSTLIKLIGGLVMPDSGDIRVCGTSMYRDFERCMAMTGVVPDKPAFYSYLTGRKNLRVLASMYKGVDSSVIEELTSELGMGSFIDEKVERCSAGERARLAVAAALLNSPSLIVLDEILSGLDPVSTMRIRDFLGGLASRHGVCVIISSSSMSDIEQVCDKVAVMDHGHLLGISPISLIKQANRNTERHRIVVDRPSEAAMYLNDTEGVGIEVHEDYMVVLADQSMIPRYLSLLGSQGFLVYEVAPLEVTMENAFVRLVQKRRPQGYGGDAV